MLNRRQLIGSAAALPLVPATVRAQEATLAQDSPAIAPAQSFRVGETTVTALSDGSLPLGPEVLLGIDSEGYNEAMRRAFIAPDRFLAGINGYLVQSGDRTMLVDSGTGGTMNAGAGNLVDVLRAAGTDPGDVTHLIATHLHPDHIGGAIDASGAVFPNAELVVSEPERTYWGDETNASGGSTDFFRVAQAALAAYEDRLAVFEGETEVAPGITAVPLHGHTPGHTGYRIDSGDDSLLIWADIVHVAPVQLAVPSVGIGFDVSPDQARETREAILERVSSDRTRIAGSHISYPGVGNIAPDGEGYRFVAAPYPYNG